MQLADLVRRSIHPAPWSEADNIPWSDPAFSARMLREHLSQAHDRGSRKTARVEQHVRWLHEEILASAPSRVLDLGCGPGLYTQRLAALGHRCLGIDFSPAAIAHARARAESDACKYVEADLRGADYGEGHDLCLFAHGEFNSFRPADAEAILRHAVAALSPGGRVLVETHTSAAVRALAEGPPTWFTSERGLFADEPHLVLREAFWDDDAQAATERYFVVHLASGAAEQLATSTQAYGDEAYRDLFTRCGLRDVRFLPGLGDAEGARADGLFVIMASA